MWLQVYLDVFLLLALVQNTCARTTKHPINKRQINTRSDIGLLFLATAGIELCETELKENQADEVFKAVISCKSPNNVLAMITMKKEAGQRSVLVTVLGKKEWKICQIPRCSVTQVCTSLDTRDCTEVKRKDLATKRKPKDSHQIELKEIKFITDSSRYSDTIIGIGPRIESSLHFLNFKTNNKFAVSEHILRNFLTKSFKAVPTAGLTTGPCFTGQDFCVYICLKFAGYEYLRYRIVVIQEPDINKALHMRKSTHAELARQGSVISIAMDANCTLYTLEFSGTKTKIRIIHLSDKGDGEVHMTVVKVLWSLLKPSFLDITKEGAQSLLAINNELYLLSFNSFSGKTYIHYNNLQNINQDKHEEELVCFLRNGKSIAFINSMSPYKARKRPLFPN